MNNKEFYDVILAMAEKFLPPEYADCTIAPHYFSKIDGSYQGAYLKRSGDYSQGCLSNLDGWYEEYLKGESLEEIARGIVSEVTTKVPELELPHTADLKEIHDKLFVRMSSFEKNRKLTEAYPYRLIGDIMITCHFIVSRENDAFSSVMINHDLRKKMGMSDDELFEAATDSAESLFPGMFGPVVMDGKFSGMCVVSNTGMLYGASAILYPQIRKEIAAMYPKGCYAVPSSTVEFMLVDPKRISSPETLCDFHKNYSLSRMVEGQFLSGRMYWFDSENMKLIPVEEKDTLLREKVA